MHIEWGNLALVAVVTVVCAVLAVSIVSLAARLLNQAADQEVGGSAGAMRIGAYALFALVGLAILFGLWLMVPYFH